MQIEFENVCTGALPKYWTLVNQLLFLLAIKTFIVLISLYIERLLLNRNFKKIENISIPKESSINANSIEKKILENEHNGILYKLLLKKERKSLLFFEKELKILLKKDRNHVEFYPDQFLFNSRVKEIILKRLITIKSSIYLSIITVLFVTIINFDQIVNSIDLHNQKDMKLHFLISGVNELMFWPGILLVVNLFLCLIGYLFINRKYYFILEETNKLFDQVE